VDLWLKTATQSDAGPMIINPVGFIEAVRKTEMK